MMQQTKWVLQALSIYKRCGRYTASQYARKHGVYPLYRIARQLDATAGF